MGSLRLYGGQTFRRSAIANSNGDPNHVGIFDASHTDESNHFRESPAIPPVPQEGMGIAPKSVPKFLYQSSLLWGETMKRFMKTIAVLAGLAAGLIGSTLPAQAALLVDFTFDNPNQTVGATDTVELWATLSNDAGSTESLVGADLNTPAIYNGSLIGSGNPYNWDASSVFDAIRPIILAPGESFNFLFGLLIPKGGSVEPGTYRSPGAWMNFNGVEYGGYEINPVTITVEGVEVPAPAALGLLLLGLAGVTGIRRITRG